MKTEVKCQEVKCLTVDALLVEIWSLQSFVNRESSDLSQSG